MLRTRIQFKKLSADYTGLEINEVFRMTMGDVARASDNKQRPAIYSQFAGLAYLGVQPAQPDPAPSNWTPATDFELALGEKGVTITGYKGKATTVNIPAVIDGSPVVAIGEREVRRRSAGAGRAGSEPGGRMCYA
jgi:hypothetical protein